MHVREKDYTYFCNVCGLEKNDSEFEDTGKSEVCRTCSEPACLECGRAIPSEHSSDDGILLACTDIE